MDNQTQPKRSYRRNWKKWVGIYLAVAVVVYLLIYLALTAHGGSGGGIY